ncbi:MAG: di-trans,poly-cis-decaprenylcistransferase [Candidatus Pelagibacter sp. TMED196]|nr:MAG: di-trans,poly-cis-decaprenylcistransferase [Candidatus Pelagibacter sp. TMED196]|tara:strand:+ start:231 stop:908 length:678 start_codon:yes stop_codon:yes gene_type:complete
MNKVNHIAIIMDGNGRWGKKKGKNRNFGHQNGVKIIEKIVKASIKIKIPILTFYTFSSENWKRPKKEITFLFKLINYYFSKEIHNLIKNNIKINIIGNIKNLPKNVRSKLLESMKKTKKCNKILVNLAINYGSQNEIIDAMRQIQKKKLSISMKNLQNNLYTDGIVDPDILIRSGGKKRLSNFLLWQMAYTEIYFVDKLWPDFKVTDYIKIINNFKKVKRNFGNI